MLPAILNDILLKKKKKETGCATVGLPQLEFGFMAELWKLTLYIFDMSVYTHYLNSQW